MLHWVPTFAKQLTGLYLRHRLMAMRPSAMGLDAEPTRSTGPTGPRAALFGLAPHAN